MIIIYRSDGEVPFIGHLFELLENFKVAGVTPEMITDVHEAVDTSGFYCGAHELGNFTIVRVSSDDHIELGVLLANT